MIYFVASDSQFVKIGCTGNVVERIKSLQTASPKKLRLKAILPGGFETESELHTMFASARSHGEWFRQTRELRWFIRAVQENPDVSNIYSLYRTSQQMYLRAKAKRLGSGHKLSKKIRRHTV